MAIYIARSDGKLQGVVRRCLVRYSVQCTYLSVAPPTLSRLDGISGAAACSAVVLVKLFRACQHCSHINIKHKHLLNTLIYNSRIICT